MSFSDCFLRTGLTEVFTTKSSLRGVTSLNVYFFIFCLNIKSSRHSVVVILLDFASFFRCKTVTSGNLRENCFLRPDPRKMGGLSPPLFSFIINYLKNSLSISLDILCLVRLWRNLHPAITSPGPIVLMLTRHKRVEDHFIASIQLSFLGSHRRGARLVFHYFRFCLLKELLSLTT